MSNLSIEDKKPLDGQIGGLNAMIFFANQKTTLDGLDRIKKTVTLPPDV